MHIGKFRLLPKGFKLSHIRYYMTVEPLGFLLYLGLAGLGTVQPQLQAMRMQNTYQDEVYDSKSANTSITEFGNQMQTYIVNWNQYRLLANIPCALFMSTFLGAWGDRNGRQFNILMGIAALMIGFCFAQSILYSYAVQAPLWTWIVMTFAEGCMGNYQLSYFAGQAYQADVCPDKDELTIRMNIVSIMRSVGSALGAYLTAELSVGVGLVMWVAIGNTVIFIAYLYIFFWILQIPPKTLERARNDYAIGVVGDRDRVDTIVERVRTTTMQHRADTMPEEGAHSNLVIETAKAMGRDFREAFRTFVRKRDGYKRGCIWALSLVGFVSTLGGAEAGQLIGTYLFYEAKPHWTTKQYGEWSTEGIIIATLGQVFGVLIFKKLLKMRDAWILNISLVSFLVSTIPIAWPTQTNMTLSNWLAILSGLTSPTMSSLITTYVEPEEVGKVLLAFSTTLLVAILGQTYVLQNVYLWTLDWFPGFMFLLVAASTIPCILLVQWCDWVEKPKAKTYKVDEIIADEVEEVKRNPAGSFVAGQRNPTFIKE